MRALANTARKMKNISIIRIEENTKNSLNNKLMIRKRLLYNSQISK